jgi:hypothetical protein
MTTKPLVGKNIYNQELARGKNAVDAIRKSLLRIIEENPGPQTQALLIARSALALNEIGSVLEQLDEIGRNTR